MLKLDIIDINIIVNQEYVRGKLWTKTQERRERESIQKDGVLTYAYIYW
jgi:hypothetical protein